MIELIPGFMIVAIVAIVSYTRLQRAKLEAGRDAAAHRPDPEAGRLRDEMRQLKDRIAVLERIVTDGDRSRGLSLEREIEALRDARRDTREETR